MPDTTLIHLIPAFLIHSQTYLLTVIDLKGKVLFVNQRFQQYFSSAQQDFVGLPIQTIIHAADRESYDAALSKCLQQGTEAVQVYTRIAPNITTPIQAIQWELSILKDEQGNTVGIIGLGHSTVIPASLESKGIDNDYYRLSLVAKNTSNAVIITDKDRKITWVNEGFTRLTGYALEEVLGKHPRDLLQIEITDEKIIQTIETRIEQTLPVHFEIQNKSKYGNSYWVDVEIKPLQDEQGVLLGFMMIENDITQRKKTEELVIMSENRLIANLDNTPNVAIQWYDEAGRIIYWNPASEKLYEWTSEEAIGKTLDQLIHTPEEAAEFLSILADIKKTGKPYGPYESSVVQKSGIQKWVLATTFSIPMGNNRTGFVCMDVDITEQKNTAKALIESEERYSSVVSAIGEGLVVQDLADKIIMCNQSAADILGLTIDQLKGKDSYDSRWKALKEDETPFDPDEHPTMITLKTGQPVYDVLMNVHTGEGQRKYIIINSRPVLNHQGKMYCAVASFKDITIQKNVENALKELNQELIASQEQLKQNIDELYASQAKIEEQKQHLEQEINERKQAEEKILAQNEVLREIAWHQSHTIRRPVATILGLIDLIYKEEEATEFEKRQYLDYLLKTTQELDRVIHTIVEKTDETE